MKTKRNGKILTKVLLTLLLLSCLLISLSMAVGAATTYPLKIAKPIVSGSQGANNNFFDLNIGQYHVGGETAAATVPTNNYLHYHLVDDVPTMTIKNYNWNTQSISGLIYVPYENGAKYDLTVEVIGTNSLALGSNCGDSAVFTNNIGSLIFTGGGKLTLQNQSESMSTVASVKVCAVKTVGGTITVKGGTTLELISTRERAFATNSFTLQDEGTKLILSSPKTLADLDKLVLPSSYRYRTSSNGAWINSASQAFNPSGSYTYLEFEVAHTHSYTDQLTDLNETHHVAKACSCGDTQTAEHVFDQKVKASQYKMEGTTDTYYKSCLCGRAGSETFTQRRVYFHDTKNWGSVKVTLVSPSGNTTYSISDAHRDGDGYIVYFDDFDDTDVTELRFSNDAQTEFIRVAPPFQNNRGYFPLTVEDTANGTEYAVGYSDLSVMPGQKNISTGSAVKGNLIYFTDTKGWGSAKVIVGETSVEMMYIGKDADGYSVYLYNLTDPEAITSLSFSNAEGTQVTGAVSVLTDKAGYYCSKMDAASEGVTSYLVETYTYTGLDVSTVDAAKLISVLDVKHSLVFGDYVALNFYVTFDASVTDPENATVRFDYADGTTLTVAPSKDPTTGLPLTRELDGKLYYIFACPVDAKEMTDLITATVLTNGKTAGTDTYSVEQHAIAILGMTTAPEKDKTMVRATLTYGAAAQVYFDYKLEALATRSLKENEE